MANATQATADQSGQERNKTTGYEVAVFELDGSLARPFVATAPPMGDYAEGKITVQFPKEFFEVGGLEDGTYQIGLRANDAGGPGGTGLSAPLGIVWQPIPVTNVVVG